MRTVFSLFVLFALWSGGGCGGDDAGAGDDDGAADADTDVDSDADGDGDADGGDTSSDTQDACDGECASASYTACTCATDDPCDWAEDGYCDGYCVEGQVVAEMFDDATDCPGTECSGLCLEVEWTIYHLPCTCDPSDPCDWAGNGVCDLECLDAGVVEEMFDDGEDCGGDAGVDAG